jgi:hypothetical protein
MKLDDFIYIIIKSDGTIYKIARNNIYTNHYQYLSNLSKQDEYLKRNSLGLNFNIDDNTPQILFFKELVTDGAIIFENQKISTSGVLTFDFYLPNIITDSQNDFLNLCMDEIDIASYVFLEEYQDETESFYAFYHNMEDTKNGGKLLRQYVKTHMVNKKIKQKEVRL